MMLKAFGDEEFYKWSEEQIKGASLSHLQTRVVSDYWNREGKPEEDLIPF